MFHYDEFNEIYGKSSTELASSMLRHTKENELRKIIFGYLQRRVPVLPSLKAESSNHEKIQMAIKDHLIGDLHETTFARSFSHAENSKSRS